MNQRQRAVDVRKASFLGIVVHVLQVLAMLALLAVAYVKHGQIGDSPVFRYLAIAATGIVIISSVISVGEALNARRIMTQMDAMEQSIEAMEELNNTIRAQRHDFLNHLQVVFSLTEMKEYDEASAYIEKVYGDITSVGRVLRTANPAVNALLKVKLAACEKAGIRVTLNISSSWKDLSIPGWEMCKVLSNLIDNAIDALEETEDKRLTLSLTEDLHSFRFSVADSGPAVALENRERIFEPGVTTKSDGHGMGLFIVRETLRAHGGDIAVACENGETVFSGWVPKVIAKAAG